MMYRLSSSSSSCGGKQQLKSSFSVLAGSCTMPNNNSSMRNNNIIFTQQQQQQQRLSISTTPPLHIMGWIQEKLSTRAQNKKAAKLVDQIALMANTPTWTIKMFADEIDETLSSWMAKMPGASRTAEMQAAKDTQLVVKAILGHMGEGVTTEDINKLDRKEKLKLVIACGKPIDEVDRVINSFKQMAIMHRILRYRKENGIELPSDEDGLKMAMQSDGIKVMTKEEKEEMREMYGKHMMKKMSVSKR
jgi:hypothetical protein